MEQNLEKLRATKLVMKSLPSMELASGLSWVRPSYFFKVNSVDTCITQELSPNQSFSTRISSMWLTYLAYPTRHIVDLITSNNTWWRVYIMKYLIIFLHSPITFSPVGPNIHSALYSNAFKLCFSLRMRNQVSCPSKADKIIVLYILICVFLNRKHEDKFLYILL
jgi:hypothetical protein